MKDWQENITCASQSFMQSSREKMLEKMQGCLKDWRGSFACASQTSKQSSKEKMLEKDVWMFERLARQFRLCLSCIHAVKKCLKKMFRCLNDWQGNFACASQASMQSSKEKMLEKDVWMFERLARQFRLCLSCIQAVKQ
ncbi:MAG: hypothetical protein U5R06_03750 [candidate division KSB1 bacterium]|nr:hypothetical protein [candidate division KSB1 bacterium]